MTYQTDERLKSYLDTNQLHREQMCLAILALDRRFSDVKPRHPRGGPDGGRDIEAKYRLDYLAYGAIGFVNQAADTEEKKRDVRNKFLSDLNAALSATPAPSFFVFMTNINLTISEKSTLINAAKSRGLMDCDILDRERLRISLDSPDGLAARFQYLGISLSEAEQASFFAKWGDDINSVIATGFQEIHSTLAHILFLQEASGPFLSFHVMIELDSPCSSEELGHFRAFCSLHLKEPKLNKLSFLFGISDKPDRFSKDSQDVPNQPTGIKHGISGAQWIQPYTERVSSNGINKSKTPAEYIKTSNKNSTGMSIVKDLIFSYSEDYLVRPEASLSLRDLDESMFVLHMNSHLASRISNITIGAGGYKLQKIERKDIKIENSAFNADIPLPFSAEEMEDPWVRLHPKESGLFHISFAYEVPKKMHTPRQIL